jgi:hypothetical protein
MCPDIWNVLHDAILVGVAGQLPGEVVLTFKCDYLRKRFVEPGDSFLLVLNGCTRLEFRPWSEQAPVVKSPAELVNLGLWILSADQRSDCCAVHCSRTESSQSGGRLEVSVSDSHLQLDSGRRIELGEIEAVAAAYWEEFGSRDTSP